MPRIVREAKLLLTAEELGKAIGLPFLSVVAAERYQFDGESRYGLKLTVSVEEELATLPPSKQIAKK